MINAGSETILCLTLSLVRLSPLQGMSSFLLSFPLSIAVVSLGTLTPLSSLYPRNLSGFFTFGTDHSLLGCLPLSTQLSSLHLPPSTSNLFPGFTLCFPSWIHLLLVYAGYCHLDWIIPSLHSASTLILPVIYSSHKQQTDFSNAHTAPWCLCLTFQRLPPTADSILRKESQILHVWLCDLSLLPSWSHFSSQSLMEALQSLSLAKLYSSLRRLSQMGPLSLDYLSTPTLNSTHGWFSSHFSRLWVNVSQEAHLLSIAIRQVLPSYTYHNSQPYI